jgi:hypothetical protein
MRNRAANLGRRRQDAPPRVVVPARRRRRGRVRLHRARARVADEARKVDRARRGGPRDGAVGGHGRAVLEPLRVAEELVVLLLDALAELADDGHEALELRDVEHFGGQVFLGEGERY